MEIQTMTPSPDTSTTTTPYVTAPSTPHRFPTFFYSAPTSPTHGLVNFQCLDNENINENDFAFNFISGQMETPSISAADELFHGGKIKPLKSVPSEKQNSFSPRCKKKDFDSFIETSHQTSDDTYHATENTPKRGRKVTKARTMHKVSRSSSPFRISDILSDEETTHKTWYNKWNLKNFLLFRSTSEGSGVRRKDPENKYSRIKKRDEDVKNASFRSIESYNSVGESSGRVMRKISAHEMHYTANRAVAEEMKKKTYLPYKSGLLGCLGFHNHGISRGITSVMKQQRGY
uniref:Uncharacterized protein n=1 Tax=Tanacetum cinerariifolium TaxID=118510 RepID=A0A699I4P6_TANCI|nr:hypothetical protein [Tanacetum cinerariifolium]